MRYPFALSAGAGSRRRRERLYQGQIVLSIVLAFQLHQALARVGAEAGKKVLKHFLAVHPGEGMPARECSPSRPSVPNVSPCRSSAMSASPRPHERALDVEQQGLPPRANRGVCRSGDGSLAATKHERKTTSHSPAEYGCHQQCRRHADRGVSPSAQLTRDMHFEDDAEPRAERRRRARAPSRGHD